MFFHDRFNHHDAGGAGLFGQLEHHQSDRAGTDHEHGAAGFDPGQVDAMQAAADGFTHGSQF